MRPGTALHCQFPWWPLASVSLCSLREVLCDVCVLTLLSHLAATRGNVWVYHSVRRSITPCDGASTSTVSRIHGSARFGKKTKNALHRMHEQFLPQCWWIVLARQTWGIKTNLCGVIMLQFPRRSDTENPHTHPQLQSLHCVFTTVNTAHFDWSQYLFPQHD